MPTPHPTEPASLLAAATALHQINEAVHSAHTPRQEQEPQDERTGSEQALATLLLLRETREQLAAWEPALIEAARDAGASWADLAPPLGVASRQAAERRYLRVRPGTPGTTGEQRVQATRNRRAADRTITTWARDNAADLRQLAGQVTALTDLPARAETQLTDALAHNDAVHLLEPLADARTHLQANHHDLADRIDTITDHTDQLRQNASERPCAPTS
ncbi:type III effector protein [Streptomyces sp. H10-C2]|uniref:type III effector protein n=1 Tax=unclassified Streptomyces TaxID=2593676 RepID=UPI0024B8E858|nr:MULTISPECIES: type III effector protein [unclassified Streptomyces]MDJ0347057.1 type III effector protein [Streptomyces sp. PH10-H1]MDJ0375579.1 type III effector protein [Streptomyces sp. H10-C2]